MSSRGLGKGLDALFSDIPNMASSGNAPTMIKLTEIEPNSAQPRKEFDPEALRELAESIAQHGVIQPITVRKIKEGHYQIIAGERRWRAAREAGLTDVPVHLIDADDRLAMELALVENLQRQDLNPIEEAEGYRTLIEEYDLTQEQAAERVRKIAASSSQFDAFACACRGCASHGCRRQLERRARQGPLSSARAFRTDHCGEYSDCECI